MRKESAKISNLWIIKQFPDYYSWGSRGYLHIFTTVCQFHRVIILNRGSMFAFQWREFSLPLSSAHRLLQCYHRQKRDRTRCNSRGTALIPPQLGSLANKRAVLSDVTLWRCTFWSWKFASLSSYSIVKAFCL